MRMINVLDLYKNYGNIEVLKGIQLNIDKGEVVSIVGARCTDITEILAFSSLISHFFSA
jgi:ABC-type histidine transport system ATPase subunit